MKILTACALAAAVPAASALAQSAPSKTPTPAPRLSGGFGRPRATPVPSAEAGGQSLADVVRAAKESREQTENPNRERSGVTIDNHSLVTNPDKGRISTSKAVPAKDKPLPATTAVPPPPRAAAPDPSEAAPAAPEGDEAQWRATAQAARKRVVDAQARVDELTAANRKLENDFYAWDDGQYRDRVIKPAWDKTRDQLEDAKRELAAAEKDVADLPEKARRAGAQPGWIRE
jgi:hypothetical protein